MSSPSARSSLREIVVSFFPWIARVRVDASKALSIRSASTRVVLAGEGETAPPVARVADMCGRLVLAPPVEVSGVITVPPILYYSPSPTAPYVAVAVCAPSIPPIPSTPGTPIVIATGSSKVRCA